MLLGHVTLTFTWEELEGLDETSHLYLLLGMHSDKAWDLAWSNNAYISW